MKTWLYRHPNVGLVVCALLGMHAFWAADKATTTWGQIGSLAVAAFWSGWTVYWWDRT